VHACWRAMNTMELRVAARTAHQRGFHVAPKEIKTCRASGRLVFGARSIRTSSFLIAGIAYLVLQMRASVAVAHVKQKTLRRRSPPPLQTSSIKWLNDLLCISTVTHP
jgi:hypothetical protein